ncbi:uncharacterized protein LOC110033750 [Phalaenopsis equestris]|uniref:uncharacterized protein LOC110033750 n=1 Tax=Phalaenopsis equestris TaxID=78828 RepID=UPI0009E2F6DA|nr:uncharacterized protein LOC110033750 [Phalaenopsis equestris]
MPEKKLQSISLVSGHLRPWRSKKIVFVSAAKTVANEEHWDRLKKDWKIWKELKRESTGLGWDPAKRTIDASDKWWAERLTVVLGAKKYKFCGIEPEFEEKLNRMFEGVIATRKYACAPSDTRICGTPENVSVNLACDSPDLDSPEIPEINTRNFSKRHRVEGKKKGGDHFLSLKKSLKNFSKLLEI